MRRNLFLLVSFVCQLAFAQMHNPVHFSVRQQKISDTEFEIVFSGDIEDGWHVYSTDNKKGGPINAELTLEHQQGVKTKGALRAIGNVKRVAEEMFDMEVSYMEGKATFSQRFVITEPTYEVSGYLTYGACNTNTKQCIPPADVEFAFTGNTKLTEHSGNTEHSEKTENTEKNLVPLAEQVEDTTSVPSVSSVSSVPEGSLWTPVIDELQAFSSNSSSPLGGSQKGAWFLGMIFFLGFLGGLAALLTPCVWPIIPMTVSFFLKRAKGEGQRAKGVRDAMLYGLSIIVIYMALGLLVTALFGASALNAMSTNAVFNIFFFLLLLVFAASFLGGFEITLPSSWSSAVDSKATKTSGLLSIFLMAFTLVLVSFSCTGPIIGFLLVEVASQGNILGPSIGMFGFAVALALPFTLFALFPSWLKSMPKSGNWMNCIKVTLGFLELAFSLKFFSVADLAYGWHLLDREVFLCLWIVIFALLGAYLIGWIRFPHDEVDEENNYTSVTRFFMALVSFAFALYMVPGLWGAPCKAVSAFAPPMNTQNFVLGGKNYEVGGKRNESFEDYEEGMSYAKEHGKPVLLDFTGYGCVNCRKMEAAVWTHPEVQQLMDDEYVVISLWVDDKTPLPAPIEVEEGGETRRLRTVGDKWSYLQRSKFGANAQPFYVLVNADGHPLAAPYSYNEDVKAFKQFLKRGLRE